MRVAVVGAGVIGLTNAVAVKSAFPSFQVKIFSETFSPETTGDGSAGIWGPYLLSKTPAENILRWAGETHRWFEHLWKSGLSSETGTSLLPVMRMTSETPGHQKPEWTQLVYGAHKFSPEELSKLNKEHQSQYKSGWFFLTYTCEPTFLLPWLMKKFVAMGGKAEKRKIRSFEELVDEGYNLIINCSGLGARELVGDRTVIPFRGQVARVEASWAMHSILVDAEKGNYIIPNVKSVVIGGTRQENDFDCTVREEDSKFIYDGCCRLLPGLKGSKVLTEWVGLRPGRPEVRLEPEISQANGQQYTVIHNYGHGGSGVTLSWGCALDVVGLIKNMKADRPHSKL